MFYKGYEIRATVADWHYYRLNADGGLNEFLGNGGIDGDSAEYEFYNDQDEVIDGGYSTIAAVKRAIDEYFDKGVI